MCILEELLKTAELVVLLFSFLVFDQQERRLYFKVGHRRLQAPVFRGKGGNLPAEWRNALVRHGRRRLQALVFRGKGGNLAVFLLQASLPSDFRKGWLLVRGHRRGIIGVAASRDERFDGGFVVVTPKQDLVGPTEGAAGLGARGAFGALVVVTAVQEETKDER